MNFSLFIDSLGLSFVCIGILLCLIFLWLIFFRIRPLKSNVSLLLTCNTYITSLTSSIVPFKTTLQTTLGILNDPIALEGWTCQINGYLIYVAVPNVFYSYILHAIFRLFRIVFYRRESLYSVRVFSILIFLQWLVVCLINIPFVLLHDMQFIASEYRCQIPSTNLRACVMVLFLGYLIPANVMLAIYLYIIRYIRRTNNRRMHRHDMMIFRKTLIIFTTVQLLSVPLSVLWLLYIIANYLTPLSYQLQAVTVAFSQSFIPSALAYSTPQIREKFRRWQRVQPIHRQTTNLQQRF